ncbi:MAG: hypothetical protein K2H60_12580 [Muribaculaceae bacterium]|nr:hypothetical protein [Muribaculaceae bacterium]
MTEENLSTLMPGHTLSIEELSNIRGGEEISDAQVPKRACDTGACSSNVETMASHCSESICRTGA